MATGALDLSANFEAIGRSPAALVQSLTGGGAITVRNGEVRYINPRAATLIIRSSDLGQQYTEKTLAEDFTRNLDGGTIRFDQTDGAFAIAAGTVRLKSLAIEADKVKTVGSASIDLNNFTLDSDWTLVLDPGDQKVEGTVPQVGIVFRGPISDPKRIIDVLQLNSYLNIRQEQRLQEILDNEESARLEKDRLSRLLRKQREDADRRVREAKQAAEAEARRQAAAVAADKALDAFHAERETAGEERAAAQLEAAHIAAARRAAAVALAARTQAQQAAADATAKAAEADKLAAAASTAADERDAAAGCREAGGRCGSGGQGRCGGGGEAAGCEAGDGGRRQGRGGQGAGGEGCG